jgi:MFS family permease
LTPKRELGSPIRQEGVFYGWRIVGALCVVLILGAASAYYTVSVFLEPIEATLGWTKTEISLGFTIAALTAAAMSPLVGLAISRFGARRVLVVGAVTLGVGLASLSQIRELWHYYILMPVLALGISSLGLLTCTACVSDWFEKRRGTATGVVFAASGLGGMVMVLVASQAVELIDWRPTYALLGAILFLIVLPVILMVIRNKPEDMGLEPDGGRSSGGTVAESPTGDGLDLGEASRTLPFWLMTFLMLCYGLIFGALTQHAIALLRSLECGEPGLIWSLTLGISVLARLLFGALADRFSKRALISITWGLHVMGLASLIAVPRAPALVFGFVLLYSSGQGGFSTVFPVRLGELFGTDHFSKLYGTILFFSAVGASAGVVVFGSIFDSLGSYGPAVSMVVATASICLVTSALIREPGREAVRATRGAAALERALDGERTG